jgi:hypothetical protein
LIYTTDYACGGRPVRSSETAPHISKTAVVRELHKSGLGPQMGLDTKTDWLAVDHDKTLTMKAEGEGGRGVGFRRRKKYGRGHASKG